MQTTAYKLILIVKRYIVYAMVLYMRYRAHKFVLRILLERICLWFTFAIVWNLIERSEKANFVANKRVKQDLIFRVNFSVKSNNRETRKFI